MWTFFQIWKISNMATCRIKLTFGGYWVSLLAGYWESLMASNYWSKGMEAWDYSSLPQCGRSKRLQLRRQDLKSNGMVASEDDRGAAMAEALGGKRFCWAAVGKDSSRGMAEARWGAAGKDHSGGAADAGIEQRARLNVAGQ
jgi:hypothetical protein